MYIENVTLKSVPADSLVLPVEEGTILTKNGTIPADLSQAYGIVPEKITSIPPTKKIYLAVAGTIDLKLNNVSFTEEEMQALGKDFNFVPGDEGGGNPNRVQTIEGTLANPWGDMTKAQIGELLEALPYHGNGENADTATGFINFDGTELGAGFGYGYFWRDSTASFVTDGLAGDNNDMQGFLSRWDLNAEDTYELIFAGIYSIESGVGTITDVTAYGSLIPTTLTIIWHPLPDQS